jgi:hypothetical protein
VRDNSEGLENRAYEGRGIDGISRVTSLREALIDLSRRAGEEDEGWDWDWDRDWERSRLVSRLEVCVPVRPRPSARS